MQTEIKKISDVEFELEINAEAADLAKEFEDAVRTQRARTSMKGFRPGKVPSSVVKKVYGKALAYGVAEEAVQQTFRTTILDGKDYDVMGQPTITDLEYEYEGDLKAVVRFGVRPTIKLKNIARIKISKLVHQVGEDDVEKEIDHLLSEHADLTPAEGPAKKDSYVLVDMQRLELKGGKPVEGDLQEGVPFLLSDENLVPELKKMLTGMKVGATKKVKFAGPEAEEKRHYEVTLREVKIRELPELDDDMVKKVTHDRVENAETLREQIREQLISGWEQRSKDNFQSDVIEKMIDLHTFDVPSAVIEMYLNAYIGDIKSKSKDKELPDGFDEPAFRETKKTDAENQARWMFIRDALIDEHRFSVSEKDRTEHFEKMAAQGGFKADMMRSYYESMPELMDQLDQAVLSQKIFTLLEETMKVTEKDKKAYEKEMKKG